jgi:hypothetical protein
MKVSAVAKTPTGKITERSIVHTTKVFQRKVGRPTTASGNCDRQQKARHEAGLIEAAMFDCFSRSDETIGSR